MKRSLLVGAVVLVVVVGLVVGVGAQDALKQLDIARNDAHDAVFNVIESGRTSIYGLGDARFVFKKADGATRAALTTAALVWVRAYVESDFNKYWTEWPLTQKPQPPETTTADEKVKQQLAEMEKNVEDAKQGLSKAETAELKATAQQILKGAQDSLAKFKQPAALAEQKKAAQMEIDQARESYARDLKEWRATSGNNQDDLRGRRVPPPLR